MNALSEKFFEGADRSRVVGRDDLSFSLSKQIRPRHAPSFQYGQKIAGDQVTTHLREREVEDVLGHQQQLVVRHAVAHTFLKPLVL